MQQLLETCVQCGFVHRDDRTNTRQRKAHFHGAPPGGECNINELILHATVCVACLQSPIDWNVYATARRDTPDGHYLFDSFNATLPTHAPLDLLNKRYDDYCAALIQDAVRWQN